ncbi:GPO family capsid scaffolding protein [Pseudoalteromonas luteoviolacea]|uniref:GPO family capsid scaffolding protein n=1 Tax=Pseudoalteromonas luteoviolacea TaxID=43657 RepID=UPI001EEE0D0F|nr:GPO family capsid scaffolding protein [Pseudoalteromonas luteoviolacea]MCF6442343.1 GPO family capsid scaffolding protein [Pseudoalteromonas luteoviolacea]
MPGQLRTIPLAIAAVGLTVDGREIDEKDIDDIVDTYNLKKYGARINIDHYGDWSGWKSDALSSVKLNGGMLGDVIEVSKEKNSDGVYVLKAVLAPNASFVQLNQADQHVYFSIEIDRNFMDTGKTYLTGLAVTDYPASTYTSRAKFSKNGSENMDVSFLRADLGLHSQEGKPLKKPFFKSIFNKDETMPLTKEDKADIGQSVADALNPIFTQLSNSINDFAKKDEQGGSGGQQDEGQGSDANNNELMEQLTQLNTKFEEQSGEFKALKDEFNKLSTTESDDTTVTDDEPTGNDGKYKNLL